MVGVLVAELLAADSAPVVRLQLQIVTMLE
jgi:hypothetical protein